MRERQCSASTVRGKNWANPQYTTALAAFAALGNTSTTLPYSSTLHAVLARGLPIQREVELRAVESSTAFTA